MSIFRRHGSKHRPVDVRHQPDSTYREQTDDLDASGKEHQFSTESQRWGKAGESREERGYPREGDVARESLPENER